MTLEDLLTHLRHSILRDVALPTLWTDAEFTLFLNEAQSNFARRTFCLSDDTSKFTCFETEPDIQGYALDPRILRIEELGLVLEDSNSHKTWIPLRDGTRHQVPRTFASGRPALYGTQVARHTLRLWPIPDDYYTVQMRVSRLPVTPMAAATDECEIDEDYQLALCDYAAWRALKNNNPEGANMASAADFRAAYELVVRDAKRDLATLHRGESAQARGNWTGKIYRGR
jgi:hypothetical protein